MSSLLGARVDGGRPGRGVVRGPVDGVRPNGKPRVLNAGQLEQLRATHATAPDVDLGRDRFVAAIEEVSLEVSVPEDNRLRVVRAAGIDLRKESPLQPVGRTVHMEFP